MSSVLAAGCGGGGSGVKSAGDVRSCVQKAGLTVREGPHVVTQRTLFVELPGGNRVVVDYFASEKKAKDGEGDSKIFARQAGGTVERKGKVVYYVIRPGADKAFKQVKDCL